MVDAVACEPRGQREVALADGGYRNFKKAVAAPTVTNPTLMIPFSLLIGAFWTVLRRLMGIMPLNPAPLLRRNNQT